MKRKKSNPLLLESHQLGIQHIDVICWKENFRKSIYIVLNEIGCQNSSSHCTFSRHTPQVEYLTLTKLTSGIKQTTSCEHYLLQQCSHIFNLINKMLLIIPFWIGVPPPISLGNLFPIETKHSFVFKIFNHCELNSMKGRGMMGTPGEKQFHVPWQLDSANENH